MVQMLALPAATYSVKVGTGGAMEIQAGLQGRSGGDSVLGSTSNKLIMKQLTSFGGGGGGFTQLSWVRWWCWWRRWCQPRHKGDSPQDLLQEDLHIHYHMELLLDMVVTVVVDIVDLQTTVMVVAAVVPVVVEVNNLTEANPLVRVPLEEHLLLEETPTSSQVVAVEDVGTLIQMYRMVEQPGSGGGGAGGMNGPGEEINAGDPTILGGGGHWLAPFFPTSSQNGGGQVGGPSQGGHGVVATGGGGGGQGQGLLYTATNPTGTAGCGRPGIVIIEYPS